MATATITFTDKEDNQVGIKLDFLEGSDDTSAAHGMACKALSLLMKDNEQADDDLDNE